MDNQELADRLARIEAALTAGFAGITSLIVTPAAAPAVGAPVGTADIEAARFADLLARLPVYVGEHYPVELRHPDLAKLTSAAMDLRMDGRPLGPSSLYGIPDEHRIQWYGNAIRADGGQGMYATREQFAAWPNKAVDTTSIGG